MCKKLSLSLLILFFLAASAFSGAAIVLKVKVDVTSVRTGPDFNSMAIKEISQGTLLEAKRRVGDWYEVSLTDSLGITVSGYVPSAVVEVVSSDNSTVSNPEPVSQPGRTEPAQPTYQPPPQQYPYGRDFGTGGTKLFGGLAMANVYFSRDPGQDFGMSISDYQKSKMGLMGGFGYEMGGRLGFEIDVLYIQKGVKFEGSASDPVYGTSGSFDIQTNLDEIALPVLIQFKFMPGTTPYILAGGEVGYVISSKIKYDVTDSSTGQSYKGTEDLKDNENLNKIDYGLVFGAGFSLLSGNMNLFVEGRYHMGLANIFKETSDSPGQIQTDDWVRTKIMALVLGIKF